LKSVGWVDSPEFDLHVNGPGHPERPERLLAVRNGLAVSHLDARLHLEPARPVERVLLEHLHAAPYVGTVERLCAAGGGRLDADTAVVPASWEAALKSAGAVTQAVANVLAGTWDRAFCSVRPPGHHATPERAMGFCLFGNAALGAQAALEGGLRRVAILDWDIHHGNGTQAIFWERSDVLYASWHQYPFYPGTGRADEIGAGEGKGFTVNCPFPAGAGESEYLSAWDERIRPALDRHQPELVIISAGFDSDRRDPLGGHTLTASSFEKLSSRVVAWADHNCRGRVVSVLEGGYSLEALEEDVAVHVATLL
jgi:acetoin utilization deacetylase AcuC-like enzyme